MKRIGSILMILALLANIALTALPLPVLAEGTTSEITLDKSLLARKHTVWFDGKGWRVLSPKTDKTMPVSGEGTVLLLSKATLGGHMPFGENNTWATSNARAWCVDYYNSLNAAEQAAVMETSVTESGVVHGTHASFGPASLNRERMFCLSGPEAESSYFDGDDDRKPSGGPDEWWLRSPLDGGTTSVAFVHFSGEVTTRTSATKTRGLGPLSI